MSPARRAELARELATTTRLSPTQAERVVEVCAEESPGDDARAERMARLCGQYGAGPVILGLRAAERRPE